MEKHEGKSPLGVEEWAFVQSVQGDEAPDSLQLDAVENDRQMARNQQLTDENRKLRIESRRLKEELEQLAFTKQQEEKETGARISKLEYENKHAGHHEASAQKKIQRLDSNWRINDCA
ncbi:hypothetical protein PRNP1_006642 [Phytophthora ramorum]